MTTDRIPWTTIDPELRKQFLARLDRLQARGIRPMDAKFYRAFNDPNATLRVVIAVLGEERPRRWYWNTELHRWRNS